MEKFLLLFIAAVVGEGTIEFLVAPVFDWLKKYRNLSEEIAAHCLRLCSALLGICIAWQLQLKFFEFAFGVHALSAWFDLVITGIVIGRGSNYVHDLIKKLATQL